jgi:beta-galactosidase
VVRRDLAKPHWNRRDCARVDLSPYKIVFAPVVYVLSDGQAERIRSYVQDGGVFVTNFRLAATTETSQMTRTPLPGPLRDVMGVNVADYVPIYSGKPGVKFSSTLSGPDGECGLWADVLQPAGAEVHGIYTSAPYAGRAAVTMNSLAKVRRFTLART